MPESLIRFVLSPAGRMSRRQWVLVALPLLGLPLILAGLVDYGLSRTPLAPDSALLWVGLAVMWPGIAMASRRLHDIDRSALLLLVIGIMFVGALLVFAMDNSFNGTTMWAMLALAFATLCSAILILTLSLQPGHPGLNRYGRDPH